MLPHVIELGLLSLQTQTIGKKVAVK